MFLKPLSPKALFLVCFGLIAPTLLVTVACLFTFQDQARIDRAFGGVRHALQIEDRVHQLVLDVHDIETGQRGYLFTGRKTQLNTFYGGEFRIPFDLTALDHDTAGDRLQHKRFGELEEQVNMLLDQARQMICLKKVGQHDAAHKLLRNKSVGYELDRIHTLADEMCEDEAKQLIARDSELEARHRTQARWLYGLLALNLGSLVCTLLLLHRLGKAESLARVCAWSKRVELEGQWLSFEEYLSRRFRIDTTHTISPSEVDRLLSELEPGPASSQLLLRSNRRAESEMTPGLAQPREGGLCSVPANEAESGPDSTAG